MSSRLREKCRALPTDIEACGPFWKEAQRAQAARGRKVLLIAGLVHIREPNPPAPAAT